MLQRIDLCKFQPKEAYTLAPVASFRWHSVMSENEEKTKKCLQPTRITRVAKDSRVIWPWNTAYKIPLAVPSGLICVINVSEISYGRA